MEWIVFQYFQPEKWRKARRGYFGNLYCFYSNILLKSLRNSGFGCWINGLYGGIFGYSDDNLLIAPSVFSLQKMLNVCEKFAYDHGLKFSTDPNPTKCKTKCIAFTRKQFVPSEVTLCGNTLPWVNEFKHLGVNLTNDRNISDHDVSVKRAQFIAKSVEIEQEFWYASGNTKLRLNQIYNSHFTGSPLWDLSSSKVLSLESSYNLSIKNMFQLPIATHRNLIVPITQQHHLRTILMLRLWGFLKQVRNSKKKFPKMMLNLIISDVRSKTGGNLRKIFVKYR